MALLFLLVAVVCELVPRVRGTRISRGVAHHAQVEVLSNSNAIDDEQLLACVVGDTKDKIIIHGKDKPFWDYFYTKEDYYTFYRHGETRSIDCKTYAPPPKASSALRHLTTPPLGDDMIGLISSFDNSAVHCRPCRVVTFKPKFLDMCNAPKIGGPAKEQRDQFLKVQIKVFEEGGFCKAHRSFVEHGHTLQSCMKRGAQFVEEAGEYFKDARRFAVCDMQPESTSQTLIKETEDNLLSLQKVMDEHRKFIDEHKQDILHINHVFEGL